MIKLRTLLEDNSAGEEAEKLGLVHKGWGRYADPKTGQVTHQSKDGKLQPVGDGAASSQGGGSSDPQPSSDGPSPSQDTPAGPSGLSTDDPSSDPSVEPSGGSSTGIKNPFTGEDLPDPRDFVRDGMSPKKRRDAFHDYMQPMGAQARDAIFDVDKEVMEDAIKKRDKIQDALGASKFKDVDPFSFDFDSVEPGSAAAKGLFARMYSTYDRGADHVDDGDEYRRLKKQEDTMKKFASSHLDSDSAKKIQTAVDKSLELVDNAGAEAFKKKRELASSFKDFKNDIAKVFGV